MPHVAVKALDQFHYTDTVNRREFFSLHSLEGNKIKASEGMVASRTPFEVAVQKRCFTIVMHPVFLRSIDLKWAQFGRSAAIFDLILSLIYTSLWTVVCFTMRYKPGDMYFPLKSRGWLFAVVTMIVIMTAYKIRKHFKGRKILFIDFFISSKRE